MHTFLLMVVWAILSGARSDTQQADVETLMDNGISLSLNIPPCFHFCFYFTNSKINFLLYLVVVLRVPSFTGSMIHVPLTCGEAFQNEPVFWKKNGNAAFNSIHFTYVKKKSKSQELSFACLLYSSSSFCLSRRQTFPFVSLWLFMTTL